MDPFDFIRWTYEALQEPTVIAEVLRSMAISIGVILPAIAASAGLRLYAKRNGREIPTGKMPAAIRLAPFADSRLNEPHDLLRRFSVPATFLLLLVACVAGIALSSMAVFMVICTMTSLVAFSSRLYVEACFAFGAEPASAPEPAKLTPLPGT